MVTLFLANSCIFVKNNKQMKTLKWYSGLVLVAALFISSCTKEEVNALCIFEASSSSNADFNIAFSECKSDFFSDGVFYIYGTAPEGNIELGDWADQKGQQPLAPEGAYGVFTTANGMAYTANSGSLEFTEINKDSKLLNGKYDFIMVDTTGATMNLSGIFSNMPYTE